MHFTYRTAYKAFSFVVGLALLLSAMQPVPVRAGESPQDDGLRRGRDPKTGLLTFLGADPARPKAVPGAMRAGMRASERARAILDVYGPEFGIRNPGRELAEKRSSQVEGKRGVTRYQQMHEGIPVMGGELVVNTTEEGALLSISGEVSPAISISRDPQITAEQAREAALGLMKRNYQAEAAALTLTRPELWIFDEHLLRSESTRPAQLVWRLEASIEGEPVRELILVGADDGNIPLHFNQVDMTWGTGASGPAPARGSSEPNVPPPYRPAALLALATAAVAYSDLVIDQARGKLYGSDKSGNKIDVIDMTTLAVTQSHTLVNGALPTGLNLSPDGNELAVAQSGLSRVMFINLMDGAQTEMPAALSSTAKPNDVIYGRAGILYVISTKGLHIVNTVTHAEDPAGFAPLDQMTSGALSSDGNTLYSVTGHPNSGDNLLLKYDVSAALPMPTLIQQAGMSGTGYRTDLALSLVDDDILLVSAGRVYDASDMTIRANNFQSQSTVMAIPGRDFYVTVSNLSSTADKLLFFGLESSYQRSALGTGILGIPGAVAVTSNGNTLFVSSSGGMTKFNIGATPPGTPVPLPVTQRHYTDLAFDMPRQVIYGTDLSNNIDVIDLNSGAVLNSYLLASGAEPKGIDLSPDGNELAIALNGMEAILFLNPASGAEIARVTPKLDQAVYFDNYPYDVAYGRAGRLYSDADPGSSGIDYLHVFDVWTHTWIGRSPYPNTIRTGPELAVTADMKYLYSNETFSPNNLYKWDIQTDAPVQIAQGPHGPVTAPRFTIDPDGSKVFTSAGQVWSGDLQEQLGNIEGGSGEQIEYIPGKDAIALSGQQGILAGVSFISASDSRLMTMYFQGLTGQILEMESSPDGSRLAISMTGGKFAIVDLTENFPPGEEVSGAFRETYTASHHTSLPGTLLCSNQVSYCTGGTNRDADLAHKFAGGTSKFYADRHGRDSIDGSGMTLTSTVQYGSSYANAYWNGVQMVYGDKYGFARADDVVAHELTHGVTQYESNLFYVYQSGAINESFSDLWGEAYDQLNGLGNDAASVRWLLGEDVTRLGAIRNMKNPGQFGDPDKMTSANYYEGVLDNGGVHTNSGVNNKAVSLMVDGGSFNGRTVAKLGWDKVLTIYYEAQTNLLTSGSDYLDLYNALYQACLNEVGTAGITTADCGQVRNATLAVQMNQQPSVGYNPEAGPLCPAGTSYYQTLFTDDFETGTDGWSLRYPWWLETGFATSGEHMLYGDDYYSSSSFAATLSLNTALPAGSKPFLYFKHAFGFESGTYQGTTYYWDGGVLEYSVNNGAWQDAGPLFRAGKNYGGTVATYYGSGNPLQGRKAFVGDSHGYVSSQYNLASLAGKNVRFRWRYGTDYVGYYFGWVVDDVSIYTCLAMPSKPLLQAPASGAKVIDYTPTLNWSDSTPALHHYQLQIAMDSSFKTLVLNQNDILASSFTPASDLEIGRTYYWRVRAFNVLGGTRGWSAPLAFKTVPRRPGLLTPAAGELLVNNRPTFEWNNAAGAASYTIQVDTTNTFVAPLIMSKNVVQPSYTPSTDLPANKTLYWRVRSNSPAGSSTWSVVRSFKTANPPGIPTLLLPANGSSGTDATPDFDWSNSTLPAGTTFDHYQIQISTDSKFTVVDMSQDITGRTNSAFTPATDLLIGAYSWRVRAINTLGQYSSWSPVFTFSITP